MPMGHLEHSSLSDLQPGSEIEAEAEAGRNTCHPRAMLCAGEDANIPSFIVFYISRLGDPSGLNGGIEIK